MNFLKPIFIIIFFAFLLGSCKSISKIPVPKPSTYAVVSVAKKAPLTEEQSKSWSHSDLVTDSEFGHPPPKYAKWWADEIYIYLKENYENNSNR